jgi:dTDP-4-dehydrorhamnose 3,5-epimerase
MQHLYQPKPELQLAPHVFKTSITGLLYIEHRQTTDQRGFFSEIALIPDLDPCLDKPFVIRQVNQARSNQNVIRGLHAEQWRKLVWVPHGTVFSALVDIRPDSSTYKSVETFMLGEGDNFLSGCLYIDCGIANSVCVVAAPVDYVYCVDALYRERDPSHDQAISLFDPELNINWPIPRESMIISPRDVQAVNLSQLHR